MADVVAVGVLVGSVGGRVAVGEVGGTVGVLSSETFLSRLGPDVSDGVSGQGAGSLPVDPRQGAIGEGPGLRAELREECRPSWRDSLTGCGPGVSSLVVSLGLSEVRDEVNVSGRCFENGDCVSSSLVCHWGYEKRGTSKDLLCRLSTVVHWTRPSFPTLPVSSAEVPVLPNGYRPS